MWRDPSGYANYARDCLHQGDSRQAYHPDIHYPPHSDAPPAARAPAPTPGDLTPGSRRHLELPLERACPITTRHRAGPSNFWHVRVLRGRAGRWADARAAVPGDAGDARGGTGSDPGRSACRAARGPSHAVVRRPAAADPRRHDHLTAGGSHGRAAGAQPRAGPPVSAPTGSAERDRIRAVPDTGLWPITAHRRSLPAAGCRDAGPPRRRTSQVRRLAGPDGGSFLIRSSR